MTLCDKFQRPLRVTYDPCDVNITIQQQGNKLYKELTKMDFAVGVCVRVLSLLSSLFLGFVTEP